MNTHSDLVNEILLLLIQSEISLPIHFNPKMIEIKFFFLIGVEDTEECESINVLAI